MVNVTPLWVIKFNNGGYFIGYNQTSPQLRKAKIYTSSRMAIDVAEDFLRRRIAKNSNISSYELVEVELREVK